MLLYGLRQLPKAFLRVLGVIVAAAILGATVGMVLLSTRLS